MRQTSTSAVHYQNDPLWLSLLGYVIGPPDADLPFAARLARENGWSTIHAGHVLREYRRFCFLAVTEPDAMTPSDAVDQAWHLHLTYTRDYWERFCPEVLGRPLHHGPTAGGLTEQARYHEQYARTLQSYERVFGEAAPPTIWPSGAQRLIDDPRARRVHPRDAIIIPRWMAWVALASIVSLLCILFRLLLPGA